MLHEVYLYLALLCLLYVTKLHIFQRVILPIASQILLFLRKNKNALVHPILSYALIDFNLYLITGSVPNKTNNLLLYSLCAINFNLLFYLYNKVIDKSRNYSHNS